MDTPWRGTRSDSAHAWSRAMSRTLKDMRAGVRERRRSAVLSRQQARVCAHMARTTQTESYVRRGRRKEEARSDRTNTQEVQT
jgi:hypothetical protein